MPKVHEWLNAVKEEFGMFHEESSIDMHVQYVLTNITHAESHLVE